MSKRTQEEWRNLASAYKRSGLAQKDWCAQQGINVYTFRDRLSKLKKSDVISLQEAAQYPKHSEASAKEKLTGSVEWQEITIKELTAIPPSIEKTGSEIKVGIGLFTILVNPNFEEASFCKVCKLLASLC